MADTLIISDQKRKALEEYLQKRSGGLKADPVIPQRPPGASIPLTFAQQQVWLHAQFAPDLPLYNEPFTVHRHGPLDVNALERSLNEIIRRHEAWRTTFIVTNGEPAQVVHPPFAIELPVHDLRNLPESERDAAALKLASPDALQPFDLAKLPLLRARLVRLADEEYRLFLNCHHLIFDGVTGYQVFLPELVHLYQDFSSLKNSSLPEPPFQCGDYAVCQRAQALSGDAQLQLEYWHRQLKAPVPVLQLPVDRPRVGAETFRGAMQPFTLPRELSEGLRSLSRQHGATLFMTLLAALDTLLYRYTGQEDILVGSITAGRNHPGTEKLLGFFLNSIVLRSDLSGNPTFRELIERVRTTTAGALSNDGVPLDRILKEIHPDRALGGNPLLRVLLSLEPSVSEVAPGWDLTAIDVETQTSKFDLCLVLDDRSEGLSGRIIYSTDLFDAATISTFVDCWQTLLQSVVADPDAHINSLAILPERERSKLLVEFNRTEKTLPSTLVHKLFESAARENPNAMAVKCGSARITYRELDSRANQLAHHLQKFGVGLDSLVAISVDRSLEMVIGILGILKAGGAYVPLDPAYPRERLEFMLNDCGASILLTQSYLPQIRSSSANTRVIRLDADWNEIEKELATPLTIDLAPEDLAYVIYTSGSTGGPKGVEITQRNLAHSTAARLDYYSNSGQRFLLLSSFAFDSSVASIFHSLCSGAEMVLPGPEFNWEARQIAELIFENQVTNILCIPSLYAELLQTADPGKLSSLQTVILAGEACPRQLVETHFRLLPNVQLFNEYGPTEATVWSTVYRCISNSGEMAVPIGRPIANTQLYILDRNLQPVPRGVPGELFIAGEGVARGYLNRAELTQQRFPAVSFAENSASRMYRTGDQVRYLPDGNVQFLGRIDEQVKIRGMRIELAEIEAVLASHPDVKEAVVTVGEEQLLLAHVVAAEQFATSAAELAEFLKARLPIYMVPSAFHFVSELPRNANGKVDRQALSQRSAVSSETRTGPVAPRDSIESKLLAIWKEVLGTESDDVTQNFFQLGGHSLLAAKMLYLIEQEFQQPLTLAFIFQAPTIEMMADWLRSPNQGLRARTIIEIQPKGLQPPLFWVRAGPRFRLLAEKLGSDRPFLGLDIPFADAIKLPTPYRIEDIASFLIKAMREVQPHGPYYLAGLCVNAVIAYEMACQLSQQGEEIDLLAMLDAHNQAYYKNPFLDGRYTGRIKYHAANIFSSDLRSGSAYLRTRLEEARRKLERTVWQLSSDQGNNTRAGKMHNADAVIHPAFHRYEPEAYAGKIALIQSSDWAKGDYFDFALGWKDLVQGVEFHRIAGDHPSMFTEPNVNSVAAVLKKYLRDVGHTAPVTGEQVSQLKQ